VDRPLFAIGALAFSTHVGHHVGAGDESGPLFFACLVFTVGVLALPVARMPSGVKIVIGLSSGVLATAAGVGNHVVGLISGGTATDGSGLLTVFGGALMIAAAFRGERSPLTLETKRRRLT
jgi:hypothetical protein